MATKPKLTELQLKALEALYIGFIPVFSEYKKSTLLALENKGLATQVEYVSGKFFAITHAGRYFINTKKQENVSN